MKNKVFSLLIFSIVALAVFASFASAAVTISVTPITIVNNQAQATTFTVHNSNTSSVTVSFNSQLTISDGNGHNALISFTPTSETIGANADSSLISATISSIDSSFFLGTFTGSLPITSTSDPTNTINLTVNFVNTPAQYQNLGGRLSISIDDTNVVKGFGSDNTWYPLDEVNVKLNIQNGGDKSIRNIVVKWELYDATTGQKVNSGTETSFSLSSGNDKTVTTDFTLSNLGKFKDHEGDNYVFYAWATGDDQHVNGGQKTSVYTSESIDAQFESDFVILNSIQFVQSTTPCGGQAELTADVVNIGSSDQNNVYVRVFNNDLNINQKVTIGDINAFEKASLDFTFNVPSNAQEKDYTMYLTVYDENNNVYENGNSDLSQTNIPLTVSGACVFNPKLTITAAVASGGKAGQELDVTASVTNTDTKARTFSVDASDYTNWATLVSVSPTVLTLNAGQTKQVSLKMNVNSDVSGDQTFNIQLTEGTKVIPQPVAVTIQKSGFSFLTGNFLGGNGYLWAIGALNVLLILIIIIVAVRVSRRKTKEA